MEEHVVPTLPSIKGSVFAAIVEDVQKLLAENKVQRDELLRWLEKKDLPVLEGTIHAHEWYDVRVYARLAELLRDVDGGGRNEYLQKRGERTARRLLDGGLYSQLEYLQKASFGRKVDAHERFEALGRDLARTTTLSSSILNFGRWEAKPDPKNPKRWVMEVTKARDYPDSLAWATCGFSNGLAAAKKQEDFWTWERVDRDTIVFRMKRDP
jgi:hypothetical protein